MMISTKSISSPGRTDKFQPPLMRFLRSNVGSRSRGRSRSSPMFLPRKKTTATAETQEPSSPKVTCMGQVRVRRSSKKTQSFTRGRSGRGKSRTKIRSKWIRNALFCHQAAGKVNPKPSHPSCPKWVGLFRMGFRRKPEAGGDSTRSKIKSHNYSEQEEEEKEFKEHKRAKVLGSNFSSPPKNALLLTRCRSAPYRSSSFDTRLLCLSQEQRIEQEISGTAENGKPSSERVSISDEGIENDKGVEGKMRFFEEMESSIRERLNSLENRTEQSRTYEGEISSCPLVLTRCKSEPNRSFITKKWISK